LSASEVFLKFALYKFSHNFFIIPLKYKMADSGQSAKVVLVFDLAGISASVVSKWSKISEN